MAREHPELPTPAEIAIREAIKEVEKLPRYGLVQHALINLHAAAGDLAAHLDEAVT